MSNSGSNQGNPVPATLKRGSLTPLEQGSVVITSPFAGMEASLAKLQYGQAVHVALSVIVFSLIVTTLIVTIVRGGTPDYSGLIPLLSAASSSTGSFQLGNAALSSSVDDPLGPVGSSLLARSPFEVDLTLQGVEPNPGPVTMPFHSKKSLRALQGGKKNKPKGPSTTKIVVTNPPPIARPVMQNKSRKMTFSTGESWNPRAEMLGYFQTLCDAERFPPVRLGGETMVPTALTTLHQVFSYTAGAPNESIVVHPRIWNPILTTNGAVASAYSYVTSGSYQASSVATLQQLAAGARVVSMKVKIYSTSSATSDQGALTCGLAPRDPGFFAGSANSSSQEVLPSAANTTVVSYNQVSASGYPICSTVGGGNVNSPANQGYNEFMSEDWTDTVPLKTGASVFWLPEDPSSLIFSSTRLRQDTLIGTSANGNYGGSSVNASPILDPFVCIGLTGLASGSSSYNVEVYLNLEYTVTSGASNVIETRPGCMSSVDQFSVAKRVGGTLTSYVEPDPEASLTDKLQGLGKSILKGGINRASEFLFGSSDVGQRVNDLLF